MLFCSEAPRAARAFFLTAPMLLGALVANAQPVPDLSVPQSTEELGDAVPESAADLPDGTARDLDPDWKLTAPSTDGALFPVSEFFIEYADGTPTSRLPAVEELLPATLDFSSTASGYVPVREGLPVATIPLRGGTAVSPFHASALAQVTQVVLGRVRNFGLVGVRVAPHPEDIDVHTEQDLRPSERPWLRIVVSVGRVKELRSIAGGSRIQDDWKINNPAHRAIRRASPIQPTAIVGEGQTDTLREDTLADYLFRLNRHPGRRVEGALAASEDGEGIALDLRVNEAKPWFVYFQSSDTGTERTDKWQHSIGAVHRQFTGRDDVLSLQYTNAGGDAVNAFSGSYEAPWFNKERPDWWKSHPDEAFWQRWMRRDALPWFGNDRLRWRVNGGYSKFKANALRGIVNNVEGSEWNVGGRAIYNAFQWHNLFVDVYTGVKLRNIATQDTDASGEGDALFVLPEIGLKVDRISETSTLRANLGFETNLAKPKRTTVNLLGRQNVERDWKLLTYDIGVSSFLEPLLFPEAWKDPTSASTSTLAHEVSVGFRGQYSFGDRLIPQSSRVVGGLFSVRGYEQSASVGDDAWVLSGEYRFHVPRLLPIQREPFQVPGLGSFRAAPQQVYGRPDWDFIIKGFVDYGRTERNAVPGAGELTPGEEDEELLGVGVGLEFRFRQNVVIRADWGRAMLTLNERENGDSGPPVVRKGDDEFHFLFSVLY